MIERQQYTQLKMSVRERERERGGGGGEGNKERSRQAGEGGGGGAVTSRETGRQMVCVFRNNCVQTDIHFNQ